MTVCTITKSLTNTMSKYDKGSVLNKFIIFILAMILVGIIILPKKILTEARLQKETCQGQMSNLYNAELQFHRFNHTYTDSLEFLLAYISQDSLYHLYIDSTIIERMNYSLNLLGHS